MLTTKVTSPSLLGLPQTAQGAIPGLTPANFPAQGLLIEQFDLYQPGYGGAVICVLKPGTTQLLPIFYDLGLTQPAPNPVTLLTYTDPEGNTYGKFPQPLYSPYPYQLEINTNNQTGVRLLPLYTLQAAVADYATTTSTGGTYARTLRDHFADTIFAADFGPLGEALSGSTNNATIAAAIAFAGAAGGGDVILPNGTLAITTLNIPQGVRLRGHGSAATTLTSEVASNVITLGGSYASLAALTLDGINLNPGSVGIASTNLDRIIFDDLHVQRFETCIYHQGGSNHSYTNLRLEDFANGAKFYGQTAPFTGLSWKGGYVQFGTLVGIDLAPVDNIVQNNYLERIFFNQNTAAAPKGALSIYGCLDTRLFECKWGGNTVNINIADSTDTSLQIYQTDIVTVTGGSITNGNLNFDGLCEAVIFDGVELSTVTYQFSLPQNEILFKDCTEFSNNVTGDGTKLARLNSTDIVTMKGNTTSATAITAWNTLVDQNNVILVKVKATAEQTNGTGYAAFDVEQAFHCGAATLNYQNQTQSWTVGDVVTGQTSGASAFILADANSGSFGALSLGGVAGTFVNGEIITGVTTGSANTNGSLVLGNVAAIGSITTILSVGSNTGSPPSGWAVAFSFSAQELRVTVAGASSTNIAWNVKVEIVEL